jgi:hypothetical protein
MSTRCRFVPQQQLFSNAEVADSLSVLSMMRTHNTQLIAAYTVNMHRLQHRRSTRRHVTEHRESIPQTISIS